MVTHEPLSPEPASEVNSRSAGTDVLATRSVATETTELAPLRSWLSAQLALGVDAELFLVAITEAGTNAIEAHRRAGVDLPIEITVDARRELVTIRDHGGGMERGMGAEQPVPPPASSRGRGLLIIRSICPDARFVATDTGTLVELPFPS